MDATTPEMAAGDVVHLYDLFEQQGIAVWIDGGWGVDALLGSQTRPHGDLDLALEIRHLPRLEQLLRERGYGRKGEPEARPWNYVLRDRLGHEVDLHGFTFDEEGNGQYGDKDAVYPAHALTGLGTIEGRQVRCIAAEDVVRFHAQYEPRDKDLKDVYALCERFAIAVPIGYQKPR